MESKDENIKIRRIERWNNRWMRPEEYKSKKKKKNPLKKEITEELKTKMKELTDIRTQEQKGKRRKQVRTKKSQKN